MPRFEKEDVAHPSSDIDACYKIVLIGDTGVGKSSLLHRFADDGFCATHVGTIGVDFKVRTLKRDDGKHIKLMLWDTAGQERFRTITTAYYRNADGIICVYAQNSPTSFENVERWTAEIERYAREGCPRMLVANKADLVSQANVDPSVAAEAANKLRMPLVRASAKDATGVEDAFFAMVDLISTTRVPTTLPSRKKDPCTEDKKTVNLGGGPFSTPASWLMSFCSIM